MGRIGPLRGPGKLGVDDGSVGAREVQGRPPDPSTVQNREVQTLVMEPLYRTSGTSTRDDVEELARFDVGDRGVKLAPGIGASTLEEHLVESEGTLLEASGHLDERLAVTVDRVADRVPVAADLGDDLGHRACAWRPTRQSRDSPNSWPEFDSLALVEDAGCLKNWGANLPPHKRTAFADERDQIGRARRQV
jgi:hypothetical protein